VIRIYTREGFPHGFYDTDSLDLDQAETILRGGGVYHVNVVNPDRPGETLIPAREVIRVKAIDDARTDLI
jgi:hypothetical protein